MSMSVAWGTPSLTVTGIRSSPKSWGQPMLGTGAQRTCFRLVTLRESLLINVERGIEQNAGHLDAIGAAQSALPNLDTAAQMQQVLALVAAVIVKIGVFLQRCLDCQRV